MLGVLDGAVLVVSAVEGVQAQTRVLMRALQRLRIPTLVFVNKIDRRGADPARVAARGRREARARPRSAGTTTGGWPRCSPTTTTRCSSRVRRGRARARAAARRAGGADPARAGAPRVLRLGAHGRGRRCAGGRHHASCCRRASATATARPPAPCSRSSAGRRGRRSPTCGCSPARCARATGLGDAEGHRDQRLRRRRVRAPRRGRGGRDRQALGPRRRPDRRRDRRRARDGRALVRSADARDRRRAVHAGRPARAARRARPARRAGPADRRAPGRRAPGARRCRSTARSRRRSSRRRWPTTSASTSRSARRRRSASSARAGAARRSRSSTRTATRSSPPSGCASTRRRAAAASRSGSRSSSARCRCRSSRAVEETVRATLEQGLHGWRVTDCAVTMTHSGYWAKQSAAHAASTRACRARRATSASSRRSC